MSLDLVHAGKVRELYDAGDDLLVMVASDRISAFDVILDEPIPDKGRVLTAMTIHWLDLLADVAPSHLVSADPADLPPGAADLGGDAGLAGDRRAGHARAPGRDAPARVHRPRLPGRFGLGRVRAVGHPPRDAAAAGACARPSVCPSPCSPRRPRPPRATTRTSPSTTPSTWWARRRPSRPATSASRPTAGPRRRPRRTASSWPTRSSSSASSTGAWRCATRSSPPTRRASGRPTSGARGPTPRRSTSSRCATGCRPPAGTRSRRRRALPAEVVTATSERYVTAYERISGRSLADWYGATR